MSQALALADELTGKLVTKSIDAVFDQTRRVNRECGASVLLVTQDRSPDRHPQCASSGKLDPDAWSSYFSTAPVQSLKPPTL